MAVTTFLPVIGRHAVAISPGDSINEIRYACAPGTPVFAVLDGSVSFVDEGMTVKSLKGRLVVTYLGVDRAESGTRQSDVLAAGQFIGRVTGRSSESGLLVRANLGDDVHDIATLLADADDPIVMWPRGAHHIVRPSNPQGPPPSPPTPPTAPTARSTDEVDSSQRPRRRKRSAPALKTEASTVSGSAANDAVHHEPPADAVAPSAELTEPAAPESKEPAAPESKEPTAPDNTEPTAPENMEPDVPMDSEPLEAEVEPEQDADELDDPAGQPASDISDETEEADDRPSVAGHRLAARRTRPALGTRRRSK